MSRHGNEAQAPPPEADASERAARVRAMLERWAEEDVSGEPDWDPSEVAPLSVRAPAPSSNTRE
jgi:hypothetical protein